MQCCQITTKEIDSVSIVFVNGYFNDIAGQKVTTIAEHLFSQGQPGLILDFTECIIINSLGVASLMALAIKATDDFQAKVVLTGLDSFKFQVLSVAGLLPQVEVVKSLDEGIRLLKT